MITIDQFKGQPISKIQGIHLNQGFCFDYSKESNLPGLVIAALDYVPSNVTQEWFISEAECGGFFCDSKTALVKELSVKQEAIKFMIDIVNEYFYNDSLDYLSLFSEADRTLAYNGYSEKLSEFGLSSDTRFIRENLTQALYPIPLTKENIEKLTNDIVDVDDILKSTKGRVMIIIVGDNCD